MIPEQPPADGLGTGRCARASRRAGRSAVGRAWSRRRGRAGPRRPTDHRRPDQDAARGASSARTPGSRSSATCNAAARRAPSTAILAHPARRMPPSSGCSTDGPTAPPQLIGIARQPRDHLAADGLCRADPGGRRADQGRRLRRGDAAAGRQLPRLVQDSADHAAGRAAAHAGRPAAVPDRRGARRRPGAGDEQRGARRGPARPRPRVHACWPSQNGFRGLRDGDIQEMGWMDVSGWVSRRRRRDRHQPLRARPTTPSPRSPSSSPRTGSTDC